MRLWSRAERRHIYGTCMRFARLQMPERRLDEFLLHILRIGDFLRHHDFNLVKLPLARMAP
jgi:hypothetical protein